MTSVERLGILDRVGTLGVWRQGDVRAPHKPLLFLLALGRVLRGEPRLVRFDAVEASLAALLRQYGPARRDVHPEYPFWWLRTDGLWEVLDAEHLTRRRGSDDPTLRALRSHGVGGFPAPIDEAFRVDGRLVRRAAALVMHAHFPDSLHAPLGATLGLTDVLRVGGGPRDAEFRREVLAAYGHRCAVCGFDVRLGDGIDLAIDAAHVKWHQAGGPDDVRNGLALCVTHHRALDRGALSVDVDGRVLISGALHGGEGLRSAFLRFRGRPLLPPHSKTLRLNPAFATWHRREVFVAPARK